MIRLLLFLDHYYFLFLNSKIKDFSGLLIHIKELLHFLDPCYCYNEFINLKKLVFLIKKALIQ